MSRTMTERRVVVTGRGVLGPLGHDWPTVQAWLKTGRNAVRHFSEWAEYLSLIHICSRRDLAEAVVAEIEALGRHARVLEFDVADRTGCGSAIEADIAVHGAYHLSLIHI